MPGEGPHAPLRNGQRPGHGHPAASEQRTGRGPSAQCRLPVSESFAAEQAGLHGAGAGGLGLVVGAVVSTWQAIRATRARQAASSSASPLKPSSPATKKQQAAEQEQQRADAQSAKAPASEEHSRRLLYASDMNLAQQWPEVEQPRQSGRAG